MADDKTLASEIETIQPAVANPTPGEVILRPPQKKRPGEAFSAPRVVCYSLIHDRPFVALGQKLNRKDGDKSPKLAFDDLETGAAFDTKRLDGAYFHEGGRCPCGDGRPVPESHRIKQIVRVARRDRQAWVSRVVL